MSITTITPNARLYTLLCQHVGTEQRVIVQYNSSAILTTDYSALVEYACGLVRHYGKQRIFTICSVNNYVVCNTGH